MAKKKVNKRKDYSFEAKIRLPAYERPAVRRRTQFLVLRGPGLNQTEVMEENEALKVLALKKNVKLKFLQANSEAEIIKFIKEGNTWASGIIFNFGTLTHESELIKKAIKGILIPTQEVKAGVTYQSALLQLIQSP